MGAARPNIADAPCSAGEAKNKQGADTSQPPTSCMAPVSDKNYNWVVTNGLVGITRKSSTSAR